MVPEWFAGNGGFIPAQVVIPEGDEEFLPFPARESHEVNGEGIEDFVGEDYASLGPMAFGGGDHGEIWFPGGGEAGSEGLALAGAGFAGGVVKGTVEAGVLLAGGP